MCLSSVDKETKTITEGWKVFYLLGDGYGNGSQGNMNKLLPHGVWLDEKKYRDEGGMRLEYVPGRTIGEPRYKLGFHVFTTRAGAVDWKGHETSSKVVKVAVDECHTSGTQHGFPVVVANKIKILRKCHVSE